MTLSQKREHPRLAMLIGTPHQSDVSMHNDLVAMYDALKRRGLTPEEILSLDGSLDRQILISFFEGVHHRIVRWSKGWRLLARQIKHSTDPTRFLLIDPGRNPILVDELR